MSKRMSVATTMLGGLVAVLMAPAALAVTLSFDDIASAANPDVDTAVPADYGGFLWKVPDLDANGIEDEPVPGTLSDAVYMDTGSFGYKNNYGSPSGNHALFFNNQFSIERNEKFQVSSLNITSFAQGSLESADSASMLSFIGVNNGVETRLDFQLSFDKYDLVDLTSLGFIDKLMFLPAAGTGVGRQSYFLFDDLTFDVAAAPVPVPAAVWLLGSGVGLLFARRRRAG